MRFFGFAVATFALAGVLWALTRVVSGSLALWLLIPYALALLVNFAAWRPWR